LCDFISFKIVNNERYPKNYQEIQDYLFKADKQLNKKGILIIDVTIVKKLFNIFVITVIFLFGFTLKSNAQQAPVADFSCSAFGSGNCYTNFTDLSFNNPTSWLWDFGDGNTDTIQNPFHTYSSSLQAGIYTVELIVSNAFGVDTVFGEIYWDPNAGSGPGECQGCFGFSKYNISGKVFIDLNGNCIQDTVGEYPLSNWYVKLEPGPKLNITDNNGEYSFLVDSGIYTISLFNIDSTWLPTCPISPSFYTVTIDSLNDTVIDLNFGLPADVYCPDLSVFICDGWFRPCDTAKFCAYYWNDGDAPAINTTMEIELDQDMTYISSNGNLISQNGNILTFDLDTVYPGYNNGANCLQVYALVSCNSFIGSTMCVEAHIFPDSSCYPSDPLWDKSSIAIEGNCLSDSLACFSIYNTGDPGIGDMQGFSEYRIYENNILIYVDSFMISGGDSLVICWPTNGNTIRLEADQRPGHPGNSMPRDNVELCGNPPHTLGQITLAPQDNLDDFIASYCAIVVASYDPNIKQVFPEGLTQAYHYIDSTDVLEYIIHFQNTGTAIAFKVVIHDRLSQYLDITTLERGASSHPYILDISEDDKLIFTFNNIMLPDSGTDLLGSQGFVQYKIHQKPNNAPGAVIENHAAIIFDFNSPVFTNSVFNTIGNIDSLTQNPCSSLSLSATSNSATVGNCDGDATVTASGGTPVFAYLWDDTNNQTNATANNLCGGTYNITVTDKIGCITTTSVTVYDTLTTVIESEFSKNIGVYPNPNPGKFIVNIVGLQEQEIELTILDVLGQVLYFEKLINMDNTFKREIDLQEHPKGIYILQLRNSNGMAMRKVVYH